MRALAALRDRLERPARRVRIEALGKDAPRLPNTACVALPAIGARRGDGARPRVLCNQRGSACSSGKVKPSHVALAMGHGERDCEVRDPISLGWWNNEAEIGRTGRRGWRYDRPQGS
jgi:cysteine desulfurase